MSAMFSFLSNNWSAALVVVLVVAICGLLAWFFKNWKFVVAGAAVLALWYGSQAIWMAGFNAKENQDAKAQVKALTGRIQALNELADMDAKKASEDAAYITELENKANATPANDSPGLPADAARRVREIN